MTSNATAKPAHQSTATDVSGEGLRATLLEGDTGTYKVLKVEPTDLSMEEALTGEFLGPAAGARLMASTANDALGAYFNAEMERGTPVHVLLEVLWIYFLQFHASMSAQAFEKGYGAELTAQLMSIFESVYRPHYEACQEAMR